MLTFLREINFKDARSSKTALFTILEALNLDCDDLLQIANLLNNTKIQKTAKTAVFALEESLKLISRKMFILK